MLVCWVLERKECLEKERERERERVMDNNGKKNRRLFNNDTEKRLMELWHEMKVSTQGEMMTNSEKFKAVAEKLNVHCAVNGWPSVTSDQVSNKIDALVAEKKKLRELQSTDLHWTSYRQPVEP